MAMVKEGRAVVSIPDDSVRRSSEVFYNPAMACQRDITMAALRAYRKESGRDIMMCDALAGSGVRSVRALLEVPGIGGVTVNDSSPRAAEAIGKNLGLNGISPSGGKAEVTNMDANALFLGSRRRYDYIDIDPFGSPINYVFNAGFALRHGSMLACTATDTGALCGSFPRTCLSRYGIAAFMTDFYKETGIRVLTTAIMLELSRHGMAFEPIYSHANHYFRVIGIAKRSKSALTAQAGRTGFVHYCRKCLYRSFEDPGACPSCGGRLEAIGPIWLGSIASRDYCASMLEDLRASGSRGAKEMWIAAQEADVPLYYGMHELCEALGTTPPPIAKATGILVSGGFQATRTRLSPTGIRTDAPYEKVVAACSR